MTFAEIVQLIIEREHQAGNAGIFKGYAATKMAAAEILAGYRDLEDAKDELAWLRASLNTGSKVRYTSEGYEFDYDTLVVAIVFELLVVKNKETDTEAPEYTKYQAQFLMCQLPREAQEKGKWYPAVMPGGKMIEIRRTYSKGKNPGRKFLHLRWKDETLVRDVGTDKVTPLGFVWVQFRINMQSGEIMEVR